VEFSALSENGHYYKHYRLVYFKSMTGGFYMEEVKVIEDVDSIARIPIVGVMCGAACMGVVCGVLCIG